MSDPGEERPQGQLFEEAAGWFARMRGPDADASRDEFEAWLSRGALHRSAYNRASEIFAMGKLLQERDVEGMRRAGRPPRMLTLAAVLIASCLIAGAAWIALRQTQGNAGKSAPSVELATRDLGGTYRLRDGSLVTLAAATRIRVEIMPRVRRLTLEAGEGRFRVAHEPRPFIVYAGGGSVTARGTVFDVALSLDRRVRVHLIEGVIDVASPAGTARARQRLVAGQSTSFAARSAPSGGAAQPGAGAAQGIKEYDGARLSELIEAANRRSARPIRISGPIGEHRVSGRFGIDDTEVLADRIAALFDLAVDRSDPSVIVLKAR